MSCKLKLAKGGNEVIMGPLLICQLHVSRPDHHHNINAGFFCSFGLYNDKCSHIKKGSTLLSFALNRILLSRRDNKQKWPIGISLETGVRRFQNLNTKRLLWTFQCFTKPHFAHHCLRPHRSIHPGSLDVILLADQTQNIIIANILTPGDVCQECDFLRLTADPLCNSLIALCIYFSPYTGVKVTVK